MKKALVIGGSNGIGLAISKLLASLGYYVIILDRQKVDQGIIPDEQYEYYYCNLLDLDEDLISQLSKDYDISLLMITAGFGRVADFEYFHTTEIKNTITVNATSTICILRYFYERIKEKRKFYCGVMGSIAGHMSSPMVAVYAASKAAICRFIESVNIELEVAGSENRILDVSPASFKGSRFNGGKNHLEMLEGLAENIISHLLASECLYIPQYEETFKGVLERYHSDPHEYGLHSYHYKKASNRIINEKRVVIGYLSDPFYSFNAETVNILYRAKHQCDYLIVGVQNRMPLEEPDSYISFDERKQIISACKYVDKVIDAPREISDIPGRYKADVIFVVADPQETANFDIDVHDLSSHNIKVVYIAKR